MRNKLISTIWAIAKELGINSEYLHVLVYCLCGEESIKSLNDAQLKKVIDHLKNEQSKRKKDQTKSEKGRNIHRLPSPQQRYFCSRLLLQCKSLLDLKDPNAYLESISKRMFEKESKRLNRQEFGSLIKQLLLVTKTKKAN